MRHTWQKFVSFFILSSSYMRQNILIIMLFQDIFGRSTGTLQITAGSKIIRTLEIIRVKKLIPNAVL